MAASRRNFMMQSLALMAGSSVKDTAMAAASALHVVLLGDSILDNGSYTGGKPDVIAQVRSLIPPAGKASLLAVDGATTAGIPSQLARLPNDATHLILSVGGNNALGQTHLLDLPVKSSADAFLALGKTLADFEQDYRSAVAACLKPRLPLTLCTIYNGNFADKSYQRRAEVALAVFNDAIIRVATENQLHVLELRHICNQPADFANPIEPSSGGGAKIAKAILRSVQQTAPRQDAAHIWGAV